MVEQHEPARTGGNPSPPPHTALLQGFMAAGAVNGQDMVVVVVVVSVAVVVVAIVEPSVGPPFPAVVDVEDMVCREALVVEVDDIVWMGTVVVEVEDTVWIDTDEDEVATVGTGLAVDSVENDVVVVVEDMVSRGMDVVDVDDMV